MNQFKKAIAEFIGVFSLVFFGCGSLMILERFPGTISPALVPIIFGLVITAMVYAVGHVSGAHFNPAVTLAFTLVRHFPKKELLTYWTAQFLGGICAILILQALLPAGNGFGGTLPSVPVLPAILWEALLTFFLMFVIMGVATDTRAIGVMAGVAIGTIVALDSFIGGSFTGASMNPARSFAPLLFEGRLDVFWIYIVGPALGASLAAFLYSWIRCETKKDNSAATGCC
jgi:aquaporin NIP